MDKSNGGGHESLRDLHFDRGDDDRFGPNTGRIGFWVYQDSAVLNPNIERWDLFDKRRR